MECQRVCFVLENFTNLQSLGVIVPDANSLISTASAYKLLLDANVHAVDATGMEREYKVLILGIISGTLDVNWHSHQLIVLG